MGLIFSDNSTTQHQCEGVASPLVDYLFLRFVIFISINPSQPPSLPFIDLLSVMGNHENGKASESDSEDEDDETGRDGPRRGRGRGRQADTRERLSGRDKSRGESQIHGEEDEEEENSHHDDDDDEDEREASERARERACVPFIGGPSV